MANKKEKIELKDKLPKGSFIEKTIIQMVALESPTDLITQVYKTISGYDYEITSHDIDTLRRRKKVIEFKKLINETKEIFNAEFVKGCELMPKYSVDIKQHSLRVAKISLKSAIEHVVFMKEKYSDDGLVKLYIAGLLHDIYKFSLTSKKDPEKKYHSERVNIVIEKYDNANKYKDFFEDIYEIISTHSMKSDGDYIDNNFSIQQKILIDADVLSKVNIITFSIEYDRTQAVNYNIEKFVNKRVINKEFHLRNNLMDYGIMKERVRCALNNI